MSQLSLEESTALCRLLGDSTRLRLMLLVAEESLSVAELTQITGLAQSRISTHLGRLREANLIEDRKLGQRTLYKLSEAGERKTADALWGVLQQSLDDPMIAQDRERALEVVRNRQADQSWVASVAGRMESQYSPGRTWEATARALIGLLDLGDVLDIGSGDGVLAELLHRSAHSVTCLDINAKVVEAAKQRLTAIPNVQFQLADMHDTHLSSQQYDQIFCMHALTYTQQPEKVLLEVARLLKPTGQAIISTLDRHEHTATVAAYDHVNSGFSAPELSEMLNRAGLVAEMCEVTSKEANPPYFSVVTAIARLQ